MNALMEHISLVVGSQNTLEGLVKSHKKKKTVNNGRCVFFKKHRYTYKYVWLLTNRLRMHDI